MLCMKAVVGKNKCRLSVAQARCKQVQNPCRRARRVEDGEDEAQMREIQISLLGARRAGVQQKCKCSTPPLCFQSARRAWKR